MDSLFGVRVSPWEIIVRGSCIYWSLFLLFRYVLRRDAGSLGVADILTIVLIADAAQNGMAGEYKSITEGLILIATIAFWNYIIDWSSFRFPAFARFAEPPLLALVRNGRIVQENMRRELLTEDELLSKLRDQGIESLAEVKHMFLEPDGNVTVIRNRPAPDRRQQPPAEGRDTGR